MSSLYLYGPGILNERFVLIEDFLKDRIERLPSATEEASNKSRNPGQKIAHATDKGYAAKAGNLTVWFEVGGENLTYLDAPAGLAVAGGSITSLTLRNHAGQIVLGITGFDSVDAAQFHAVMAGDNAAAAYQMLVSLGAGATTITGSDVANGAVAGTGDDMASMGDGDDTIVKFHAGDLVCDGGNGSDTLSFNAELGISFPTPFVQQLVVDLGTGAGQNPYGGNLQLTSVENVYGTPNADKITGSDAANVIGDAITETAGDVINALGGDDVIGFFSFAGFVPQLTGAKIDGGAGTDTLVFQYDQKGNVLDLTNQANNAGMFRDSTFTSIEQFVVGDDFSTSFGDLTFKGDGSANYLEVRQGPIAIDLGGDGDTLKLAVAAPNSTANVAEGGDGIDRLIFNAAAALNILDLVDPANNTFAFANWQLTGFEVFEAAFDGSSLASSSQVDFRGDETSSTFIGGAGADFFRGGGGIDVLIGGGGADTYTFAAGDSSDIIIDVGQNELDTLRLTGIGQADIELTRAGNDLLVGVTQSSEVIRVTDHFLGGARGLEKIEFTGGIIFDRQQILDQVAGAAPDASPKVGNALVNVANEGSGVTIVDLLAGASDSDGDKLAVANVGGLGPGMTVVGNTLHIDRSAAAYESFHGGGNRNFQVTYDIVDGRGGSVAQKATIAITGVNDAATIGGTTTGTVTEDGATTTYGFLSIVDVDVNSINGASEARFKTQTPTALTYGTFSLVDANAGLWVYELDNSNAAVQALKAGQTLTETAQVKAFDNTIANIVITIDGFTDGNEPVIPPTGHDDAYVVLEGKALTVAASTGVLFNDEGTPPLAASKISGPSHGTLQLATDGGLTYTPNTGFEGIDSFTYRVSNGGGLQDAVATVHVVPVSVGATTTLDLLALSAEEQIAANYVAFFGRAADAGGFGFWVDEFDQHLPTQGPAALFANIASSFGISAEAKGLYPFLVDPFNASDADISAFLGTVYDNLFNRGPDAGGLGYWTDQIKQTLAAGQFVGSVLVNIVGGAQDSTEGKDITTLMGKVAISLAYVREQDEHDMQWAGAADVAAATQLLNPVTDEAATVLLGVRNAEALVEAHG